MRSALDTPSGPVAVVCFLVQMACCHCSNVIGPIGMSEGAPGRQASFWAKGSHASSVPWCRFPQRCLKASKASCQILCWWMLSPTSTLAHWCKRILPGSWESDNNGPWSEEMASWQSKTAGSWEMRQPSCCTSLTWAVWCKTFVCTGIARGLDWPGWPWPIFELWLLASVGCSKVSQVCGTPQGNLEKWPGQWPPAVSVAV